MISIGVLCTQVLCAPPCFARIMSISITILLNLFFKRQCAGIGTRRKICIFLHIIKCQSINYNSVRFQVNRLRNKEVTIYRSALLYKQEGASLRHFDFMLFDGSDERLCAK